MTRQLKKWLPALFLLLYPLRHVNMGLDLMDAGYALGNYCYFDTMNQDWKLATYLANVAGMLLSKLPGGGTWVGMNAYTALLLGLTAGAAYLFLRKRLGHPLLVFLGELLAVSLCWAPTTILYHYLGYYAMTAAVLLLYEAITVHKGHYYIIAGVMIGASVCVRLPNITYAALILPIWYAAWRRRDAGWLRQTLFCIAGFLAGFLVPFGVIVIRYGVSAYPDMIAWLFGMTDTATDYKPTSMLTTMFTDYALYSKWLLLFFLYYIASVILFKWMPGRCERIKQLVYLAGMALLLRFCYGRGMFGLDYQTYFSMYKWAAVFQLLVIAQCVWLIADRRAGERQRLWGVFLLVIIFITPLGSNNGLYPLINNLFLVAPVSFVLWLEMIKKNHALSYFPARVALLTICGCTMLQGVLFGWCFVFHDTTQAGEQRVEAVITGSDVTAGLYAQADKVAALDGLGTFLSENELLDQRVILYGNIPAIAYLFDMEPAVFSTWPDLDSNSIDSLQEDLEALSGQENKPVVILSAETLTQTDPDAKRELILQYIEENAYTLRYENDGYAVYVAG